MSNSENSESMRDRLAQNPELRRRAFIWLAGVVAAGLVLWLLYWLIYASHFESTNDAYVAGDVVSITAQEKGTVLAIHADDTQSVKRGDVLVELDPAGADISMQSAQAELARMVRQVRALFAKADELRAQLVRSRAQADRAESDYRRRVSLEGDGSVSAEDIAHARAEATNAKAALAAAEAELSATLAHISGTTVSTNPDVLAATAKVRDAALGVGHMRIASPVDGVVVQKRVQVGQYINPAVPLMAVAVLDTVWIDANFKEDQLHEMRVGQPVTIEADIYGGDVVYHGKVAGLGAGSGSAFALLPPQNASGNWIKIVQRVPVRIVLDPQEVQKNPLRIGLSARVTVDVRDDSGPLVATQLRSTPQRAAPDPKAAQRTEAMIAKIITDNGGDTGQLQ